MIHAYNNPFSYNAIKIWEQTWQLKKQINCQFFLRMCRIIWTSQQVAIGVGGGREWRGERHGTSVKWWGDPMVSLKWWVEVVEKDSDWKDQMWTLCASQTTTDWSRTFLSLSITTQPIQAWFSLTVLRVYQDSPYLCFDTTNRQIRPISMLEWMVESIYLVQYTGS